MVPMLIATRRMVYRGRFALGFGADLRLLLTVAAGAALGRTGRRAQEPPVGGLRRHVTRNCRMVPPPSHADRDEYE